MKHLPFGLFIGHLLFISGKSLISPVTFQELGLSGLLLLTIFLPKALKLLHKGNFRQYLIEKEKLDLEKPTKLDPEIAGLLRENELASLRLRKFMTEQEFNKREITRALEKQIGEGGVRF